ncbi:MULTISPECIES: glycerate kinase [Sphingobacterium]|uniref:Glycerate kinase n=1 Tax=Sphingobacterium hotanense TaxID=649196 RepID=A0ABT7NNC6_9SPHI|nr:MULTISPECIES: glycerate kinase [Sphingobacterium]MDM1048649.1 glycerate kinase [Sphingobacterium hotanense]
MKKILIAPNSFKGALTAEEVAQAIETGLKASKIQAELIKFPIADGGDHTSYLLSKHLKGKMEKRAVKGVYLQDTEASYALLDKGKTAIIEVAETTGFKSISGKLRSPIESSSYGLGELIKYNLDQGVLDFIICLGGSASVDGGIGMLQALGMEFLDKAGKAINATSKNYRDIKSFSLDKLKRISQDARFTVLCDVENKLLGADGAAAVFGPQKGASPEDVKALEAFLGYFDKLTEEIIGKSLNSVIGGGAAGGLGAAFIVFLNADIKKGAAYFFELTKIEDQVKNVDWVITGEGSIDSQSLEGKAPVVLAELARKHNKPIIGLAGNIPLKIDKKLQDYFAALLSIGNRPEDLEDAIQHTADNLTRTAKQLGLLLSR